MTGTTTRAELYKERSTNVTSCLRLRYHRHHRLQQQSMTEFIVLLQVIKCKWIKQSFVTPKQYQRRGAILFI